MTARTYEEIAQFVESIGLPCAYYQFDDGTPQAPPFICWIYGYNPVYADNSNFVDINEMTLELYTRTKDIALEAQVEAALKAEGFSYSKESTYINSERIWQTAYMMEVIINAE